MHTAVKLSTLTLTLTPPLGEVVLSREVGNESAAAVRDVQDSTPAHVLHGLSKMLPEGCRRHAQGQQGGREPG